MKVMHKEKFRLGFVYICAFSWAFSCYYAKIILKSPSQNSSNTTEHKLVTEKYEARNIYAISIGSIYISLIQSSREIFILKIV